MDSPVEKVHVALGSDLQDGFKTLEWTKRRWWPKPISIVILDLSCNITKDFVYTPFGKLPASLVSDEKLEVAKKFEQAEINKLLNTYIAFCGKVKAEILKVEKTDEPIYKALVELMNRQRVTKFVMAITFMKSSFWKSKNAISGSYYIHEHKPEFCEFYLICGGNLIVLRGENEDVEIEDDQGVVISRRSNVKSWLGKMLHENSFNVSGRSSDASPTTSKKNHSQWEYFEREIDGYYEQLPEIVQIEDEKVLQDGSYCNVKAASRRESNRRALDEARNEIEVKKQETRANSDRRAKAEWAILLCNSRVEELEAKIKEELVSREETSRNLDAEKEQIEELTSDVEQVRNRLRSIRELRFELSNKLQISSVERSNMEVQLENAVKARAEMVREIEELRKQRDVLNRRIEFCREKDAIGMVTKLNEPTCGYRQYNADDVKVAADDFSERMRLKSGDDWTDVYRGRISQVSVAIKLLNQQDLSEDDFLTKVKLLNEIRHPNLVAMMGFCADLKCVIFEYMHNGNLRDILVSSQRIHRRRNRVLRWNHRIRIAREVCLGLSYLHSAHPRPIVHGNLCLSNVLLDRNLVAKISGFGLTRGLTRGSDEHDTGHDIRGFGVLLLDLLRGANRVGLSEETVTMGREALARALDETGGQWPLDLVEELVRLASWCLSTNPGPSSTDLSIGKIMEELNEIKKKADDLIANVGSEVAVNGVVNEDDDSIEVPSIFLCPILQDVMKNPHVAADGFSYELEAIEEWFRMGRDTSPMTNLKLKHKFLTPNHTLRFLVEDWHNNTLSAS